MGVDYRLGEADWSVFGKFYQVDFMLFFVDEEVVDVDGCYLMEFVECALLLVPL